jgi:thioredoxin-like negative regulator of GroEL
VIEQLLQADRLLTVDQIEQARQMYARVAEADPRNAIAIVGLARCALAEGDDRRAQALAADALRVDPENDMARRMSVRLAEILAARGEPLPGTQSPVTRQPSDASRRSFLDRLRGR